MEYKDYYHVLSAAKNADEKAFKRAYCKPTHQYHSAHSQGGKSAEEEFKVNYEAYEVLGFPEIHRRYDQLGQTYRRYQQLGGYPAYISFSQRLSSGGNGRPHRIKLDYGDLFRSGKMSTILFHFLGGR